MIDLRADPRFVDAILDWRWTPFLARLLLVGAYVISAFVKLADFPGAVAEQAQVGMHPPMAWAILTIAIELVGPALVLFNRLAWLGAGMLGVFTALAAFKAHAFWTLQGPERFMATNTFFEHMGLVGGFILAALVAEHALRTGRP